MITLLPALLVICGRWVFWPSGPTFGSAEPTPTGPLGQGRPPDRACGPRAVWVGTAAGARRRLPGHAHARRQRPDDRGLVHQGLRLDRRRSRCSPSTAWSTPSNPIMVVGQRRPGPTRSPRRCPGSTGSSDAPAEPVVKDGVAFVQATIDRRRRPRRRRSTRSSAARDAVHADRRRRRPGRRLLRDLRSTSRTPPRRDNLVIIPIVLVVVMLILMLLLRAVLSPAAADRHRGAVVRRRAGARRRCCSSTSSASPAPTPSFPLFVFVFLVALGIDYNIFLMTRVREETQTRGHPAGLADRAVGHRRRHHLGRAGARGHLPGARHPAAGVPSPRSASRWRSGVLLDTIIVRSVLVTALNLDLGSRIWWPSKLDRGEHAVAAPDRARRAGPRRGLRASRRPASGPGGSRGPPATSLSTMSDQPTPQQVRRCAGPRRAGRRPRRRRGGRAAPARGRRPGPTLRRRGAGAGRRPGRRRAGPGSSPTRPRSSSRSPGCAATTATTAPSSPSPASCAAPARRCSCPPTRSSTSPAAAPSWAARKRCSPSATGPRTAGPRPASGSTRRATTTRSPTSGPWRSASWRRPGCCRTSTPASCRWTDFHRLKPVAPSMGMMLETTAPAAVRGPGGPHYGSPDKEPAVRLRVLEDAGRLSVPFTTGLLIGIGETFEERAESLFALRRVSRALPRHPGSDRPELPRQAGHRDARMPRRGLDEYCAAIAVARLILGPGPASRPRRTWSTRSTSG